MLFTEYMYIYTIICQPVNPFFLACAFSFVSVQASCNFLQCPSKNAGQFGSDINFSPLVMKSRTPRFLFSNELKTYKN